MVIPFLHTVVSEFLFYFSVFQFQKTNFFFFFLVDDPVTKASFQSVPSRCTVPEIFCFTRNFDNKIYKPELLVSFYL